jgi:hypothetical protein
MDDYIRLVNRLEKEWDKIANTGAICISILDALYQQQRQNQDVTLFTMDLSEFSPAYVDLILGFGTRESAADMRTDITVSAGNLVIGKTSIYRGRRVLAKSCVIPLIALSKYSLEGTLRVNTTDKTGIFAICAACNRSYRTLLAYNKYSWGQWVYDGNGGISEKDVAYDGLEVPEILPKRPRFGSLIYKSNDDRQATKNASVTDL